MKAATYDRGVLSSGVARILFLGGPGQKWAGTNGRSPVVLRKSAAPNS